MRASGWKRLPTTRSAPVRCRVATAALIVAGKDFTEKHLGSTAGVPSVRAVSCATPVYPQHLPELPAEAWLSAEQKNLETIHCHDVIAARTGLVGELRAELDGTLQGEPSHPSQETWLAELS